MSTYNLQSRQRSLTAVASSRSIDRPQHPLIQTINRATALPGNIKAADHSTHRDCAGHASIDEQYSRGLSKDEASSVGLLHEGDH